MNEKRYELKKDINTPSMYWRAGNILTGEEWIKELSLERDYDFEWNKDWFIDLSKPENIENADDDIAHIVDKIFKKANLYSLSYKEAARQCCKIYALLLKTKTP